MFEGEETAISEVRSDVDGNNKNEDEKRRVIVEDPANTDKLAIGNITYYYGKKSKNKG